MSDQNSRITTKDEVENCPNILYSSDDFRKKLFERINGLSSKFNINYSISPKLRYEYPPINEIILENICSSLIACPKLYVQTLHLMNKMNLPCPLVPYVRVPSWNMRKKVAINQNDVAMPVDMSTSEDESEIEAEIDRTSNKVDSLFSSKRSVDDLENETRSKRLKVKSLLKSAHFKEKNLQETKETLNLDSVFEKVKTPNENARIKIQISSDKLYERDERVKYESEFEGFAKIFPLNQPSKSQLQTETNLQTEELTSEPNKFITLKDLEKNRMKISELKQLPVYNNYEQGEVNSRLYIKNIAKKIEESDLKYVYGRYIDWSNETQRNSFDIRLMKEGRMKGQAFITFPNEEIARRALEETNGYIFGDKPILVQFARSAKPK
jgi:U11/U12 small nuclear ribonucleoprotein SNRNP65